MCHAIEIETSPTLCPIAPSWDQPQTFAGAIKFSAGFLQQLSLRDAFAKQQDLCILVVLLSGFL
jgi:hypothetical protein